MYEEPKYRAEIFKIAGIALLGPFAKFLLNPFSLYKSMGIIEFLYFLVMSIFSFYIGLVFIEEGRAIIQFWERKLWKK